MNWLNILYGVVITLICPAILIVFNRRNEKKDKREAEANKISDRMDKLESAMADGFREIRDTLQNMKNKADEDKAVMTRQYIIDSAEDLTNSPEKLHTKEWWDKGLRQCQYYDDYCREHEEFKNYVAVYSISLFREAWENANRNNTFAFRTLKKEDKK